MRVGSTPLRRHQCEAVQAITAAWARGHDRTLVVMPCGTGKTVVATAAAAHVHNHAGADHADDASLVVVFVPSRALLKETIDRWRAEFGPQLAAVVAVGSERSLPTSAGDIGPSTTDPDMVALRLHARPRTGITLVVCTYHSAPVLAAAQQRSASRWRFDLAVYDEAHHLTRSANNDFAASHIAVDAQRRLFLTATPTVGGDADPGWIPVRSQISMDDETVFGPVVYRMSMAEARKRGLVVDWKVVVRSAQPSGDQLTAAAATIWSAIREFDLHRMIVFTNRVRDARQLLARFQAWGPVVDGVAVDAWVIEAATPSSERNQILDDMNTTDPGVRILINVNCVTEGVDIPAVDSVTFVGDRSSRVAITQSIGRALRPYPGKRQATIVLPVTMPVGNDDHALSSGPLATVWATCRALRDIDDGFAAALQHCARRLPFDSAPGSPPLDSAFDIDGPWDRRVMLRTVAHQLDSWWSWFGRAERHAHTGAGFDPWTISDSGLRNWCAAQRRLRSRGLLARDRAAALEQLEGWFWQSGFTTASEAIRTLVQVWPASGRLDDIVDRPIPGWTSRVDVLAAWARVSKRRGILDPSIEELLSSLPGWNWELLTPSDCTAVDAVARFVAWEGHGDVPVDHCEQGVPLGDVVIRWRQDRVAGTLDPVLAAEVIAASKGKFRWKTNEVRWAAFITALTRWCEQNGSMRTVAGAVVDTEIGTLRLGAAVTRIRHQYRRARLTAEQIADVETIPGWSWESPVAERRAMSLGATRHGTRTGYAKGCRCQPCTQSNRVYAALQQQRLKETGSSSELVCAQEATAAVQHLVANGLSTRVLSMVLPLSRSCLSELAAGRRTRVTADTNTIVQMVTVDELFDQVVAGAAQGRPFLGAVRVPSQQTTVTVTRLLAAGWPMRWILNEVGRGSKEALLGDTVSASTAAAVRQLAARVGDRQAPDRRRHQATPRLDDILAAEGLDPSGDRR